MICKYQGLHFGSRTRPYRRYEGGVDTYLDVLTAEQICSPIDGRPRKSEVSSSRPPCI